MGKECFEKNESFDYLREPDIPFSFMFVFKSFLEIFNHSGETVTWTDIKNWSEMRRVVLTQFEIDHILMCIGWANSQIKKMRDEDEITEDDEGQT